MTDNRSLILDQLLPLVPFDGWSDYAFAQAMKRAGLTATEAKLAFPGGVQDCLDYFFTREDEAMQKKHPETELKELRVPERIERLVMGRLNRFAVHREAARRALAHGALPWNLPRAIASVGHTVDLMWRLAGDASVDFNYYTKRMTLAGVYSATLLFWLNEETGDMEATRAYLKRRLGDVAAFGKWKKDVKAKLGAI